MKLTQLKSLLIASFGLLLNIGFSQTYFEVPDTDFQQFLSQEYPTADTVINGIFYIDGDNPEILTDTSLILPNSNIVDVTGIEAFVNITYLDISYNNVSVLPMIPPLVTYFNAYAANLTSLPPLPSGLETLITTSNTQLNSLPSTLPSSLKLLTCVQNNLTSLPPLPSTLKELNCSHNLLTNLPTLPLGIELIRCDNNPLTSFPSIPATLKHFNYQYCDVTVFPTLPDSLYLLNCGGNDITVIPDLPDSLYNFRCNSNLLTSLPELPSGLTTFDCSFNQLNCLPVLPQGIYDLDFSNNAITCLPNYIPYMTTAQLAVPLCLSNDPINNPNGCNQAEGVSGIAFNDTSNNCIDDLWRLQGVPFRLEDDQNNFLQSTLSTVNGSYMFAATPANYTVKVDENALPNSVEVVCPVALEYNASTTSTNPVSYDNDFGLNCNGFDIAALGGIPKGLVFPGQTHVLKILAGDVSNFANMNCASGISGEVSISVSGPSDTIVFNGNPLIVNDSTAIYSVADFGMQALDTIFLEITTDTLATIADTFRVQMHVTSSVPGDIDVSNDTSNFLYPCINSYDPNKKVVFPEDVLVGYDDPFTYTIYFQNTGNAPAINIRLEDFIDDNLDLESFRLISASHNQTYTLNAETRKLTVRYPDIYLPDSLSEPLGSIGYFHYRINPVQNVPVGTIIENTASIFFDFNEPIITNTTENLFYSGVGLNEVSANAVRLFPNPSNDRIFVNSESVLSEIEVYSVDGSLMYRKNINSKKTELYVSDFPNGMYIVRVNSAKGTHALRFVKQD